MSYWVLSFPNFKFCQTAWLTMRKTLPFLSFYCVNLLICLSAWASPAKSWITICCFMNTVESAFCFISAWRPMTRGMWRWNLIDRGWTRSSFSVFLHGAVCFQEGHASEKGRLSSCCQPLLYAEESYTESIRYIIMIERPVFRRIKKKKR